MSAEIPDRAKRPESEASAKAGGEAAINAILVHDANSSVPEPKQDYSVAKFAGDLLRSAAYSAIAAPTEGLMQTSDFFCGSNLQDKTRQGFEAVGITAPQPGAEGAKWLAQTIGQAGMVVPLMVLHKPVKAMLANQAGVAALTEQTTLGLSVRESVATGFLQGSLLTPTESSKGFLPSRIESGFSSAVQFAGMTAFNYKLNKFAETGTAFKYGLNRMLTNPLATGVVSGVPGGFMGAEVEAIRQGNLLPTGAQLGESILSQSIVGGIFGAKQVLNERSALKPSLNSQTQALLSHPDAISVMRAPRTQNDGPQYLDTLPGIDGQSKAPGSKTAEYQQSQSTQGTVIKDGNKTTVKDEANGITREYVGSKLISAMAVDGSGSHTYAYNSAGELRAIVTSPKEAWFKVKDGWAMGRIDETTGRLALFPAQAEAARTTADGVIFSKGDTAWSLSLTPRFLFADKSGAMLTHRDMKREQSIADSLTQLYKDKPGGSPKYAAEDGRPLSLPEELQAFRQSSEKHGIKSGFGQVEAEVNKALSQGNEAEALGLLLAAQKLAPKEGANSLSVTRNNDGTVSMMAEGYLNGDHVRYLLDGTVIKTGQMMRTTTHPDGSRVEESFGGLDNKTAQFSKDGALQEIKWKTGGKDLVQEVRYDQQGQIDAVSFSLEGRRTILQNLDGNWQLRQDVQQTPQKSEQVVVDIGKGKAKVLVDGSVFLAEEGAPGTYISGERGKVTVHRGGAHLDLTPGSPMRVRRLNPEKEAETQTKLVENLPDELKAPLQKSEKALQSELDRTGIDEDGRALLAGQVNQLLQAHPQKAVELQSAITQALASIPGKTGELVRVTGLVSVDQTPQKSTIYIGNKAVEVYKDGSSALQTNPPVRFDGHTSAGFRADVKTAAQNDLNPAVSKFLEANNVAIVAAPDIAAVAPEIASTRPAGWPNGATSEALGAVYDPARKIIAVGETHKAYVRDQVMEKSTENPRLETLRAVGQAVDALTGISQTKAFKEAFRADEAELKEPGKVKFYRDQKESENFAVTFVDLFTGTQMKNPQATALAKHFPRTAALVEQEVRALNEKQRPPVEMQAAETTTKAAESTTNKPSFVRGLDIAEQPHIKRELAIATGTTANLPEFLKGKEEALLPGSTRNSHLQTVERKADGTTEIIDNRAQMRRIYDKDGRLSEASPLASDDIPNPRGQRYLYDENGHLKAAFDGDTAYIHTDIGWQKFSANRETASLNVSSLRIDNIAVHPEGGLLIEMYKEWNSQMANGQRLSLEAQKIDLDSANLPLEKKKFSLTMERLDEAHKPAVLKEQVETLLKRAEASGISAGQQGAVLAEFTRRIEKNPDGTAKTIAAINSQLVDQKAMMMFVEHFPDGRTALRMGTSEGAYRYYSDGTREEITHTAYGSRETVYDESGQVAKHNFMRNLSFERKIEKDGDKIVSIAEENVHSGAYQIKREGEAFVRVFKDRTGHESTYNLGPGRLETAPDESIIFVPKDQNSPRLIHSKNGEDSLIYANGRQERLLFNGRRDYVAADVNVEGQLLRTNLRSALAESKDSQGRIERFENLLGQYEKQPVEGVAANTRKALVLLELNRLMSDGPNTTISKAQKADIAEQLLSHALDPVKVWQGAHPTCNVTTVEHRLMVQAPQRLIAMVGDVINQGTYTRSDGKTFSTTNLSKMFSPDREASSNLAKQADPKNPVTHEQGERDWASQIAQIALLRGAFMDKAMYISGNQLLGDHSVAYIKDASGKPMPVLINSKSLTPLDVREIKKETVFLENGNVGGMASGKDIVQLFDKDGKRLEKIDPGQTAYDYWGRPQLNRPQAEELAFGNMPASESALVLFAGDRPGYLIDDTNRLLDTPQMTVEDIANAYKVVDADNPLGANIIAFNQNSSKTTSVSTSEDLVKIMAQQEARAQMPAILLVHTRNQAFGHWHGGGPHVVNLYQPTEGGAKLRYSNQWGAGADYMAQGMWTNLVFAAMRQPVHAPDMPQIAVPVPKPQAAPTRINSYFNTSSVNQTAQPSRWFRSEGWLNFLNSKSQ